MENFYYPQSNTSWYPRYGFLTRSTFDLTFRHRKNETVASLGKLAKEGEWPDDKDSRLSQYVIDTPVLVATFAAGLLERHTQEAKLSSGLTLDFYSPPASVSSIKESFILNEMDNAVNFFSSLYGPYPFSNFRATFHPSRARQANSTLIWLPRMDEANRETFAFIGRQTGYQWWGNLVTMRSHRDQWLADGFAEYSGMLFTNIRHGAYSMKEQLKTARFRLPFPPDTDLGKGSGKLAELGPLVLGKRLQTRNTLQASYETLIDNKGALVLRMLHFLFSNPNNMDDKLFSEMLKQFVQAAGRTPISSENFMAFAGQKFAETPIAKTFGLKDLGWFFQQWITEAKLPSYRMEYRVDSSGNEFVLSGNVIQENAGKDWFMPLPITVKFQGRGEGHAMVYANGPTTPFKVTLPMKPESVDLDPDMWILSEKTSTKKM
jgi:aminopeptidase N